jgi:hypothetical protein
MKRFRRVSRLPEHRAAEASWARALRLPAPMVFCPGSVGLCLRTGAAIAVAAVWLAMPAAPAFAGGKRLRPPPSVSLHPDRGMTFSRFSKTSHDQRVFGPLNQATRLPVMNPAIDPYNLHARSSVYDPQTGQIRGSVTDAARDIRRAQEAIRRAEAASRRASKAAVGASSAPAR